MSRWDARHRDMHGQSSRHISGARLRRHEDLHVHARPRRDVPTVAQPWLHRLEDAFADRWDAHHRDGHGRSLRRTGGARVRRHEDLHDYARQRRNVPIEVQSRLRRLWHLIVYCWDAHRRDVHGRSLWRLSGTHQRRHGDWYDHARQRRDASLTQ